MPVYFRQTWSLCLALWGPLKYFDSMGTTIFMFHHCQMLSHRFSDAMEHPYAYQMARKDSLSKWLMKANDTTVENILKAKSRTINQNERILALLTARRIQEAAEAACENGDLRLSVLLGTLGGCVTARALLLKQLSQWLEVQVSPY